MTQADRESAVSYYIVAATDVRQWLYYLLMETTVAKTNTSLRDTMTQRDTTGAALDKAGAAASLLCAIHCALMPIVLTLLPLAGLAFLADERVDWALISLSAVLGISSLCLGYRRHRSRRALAFLSAGLALLVLGHFLKEQQHGSAVSVLLLVAGGATIAAAHWMNRRLCNSCIRCHEHDACDAPAAD